MKVRLGTVEDIDLIVRLNNELNQMMSKLQPDDFKKISEDIDWVQQYFLNEKADYLLLEDEGESRGLALVEQLESIDLPSLLKRHYVYLVHLVVDPLYRGCGYGHELFKAAKDWGKDRQLEYIELSVLANNQAALMFYEKEGLMNVRNVMRTPIK